MSPDLSMRIRSYAEQLEGDVEHVTMAELEELLAEPTPGRGSPGVGPLGRTESRWPRWAFAFTAALVLLLVVVGLPLWLFGGEDVADQTTTTVATTTSSTVPTTPPTMVESWQQVGTSVTSSAQFLFDMAPFGSGFVSVGLAFNEEAIRQNSAVFVSENGIDWNRMGEGTPELTQGAVLMYGVAEGGPGLIAVGMGCESSDPCRPYPTVWTSSDGVDWSRFGADAGGLAENEFGAMFDVLATDHGIVGVGQFGGITENDTLGYQPSVWLSPDGVGWTRVFEGEPVEVEDVMGGGPGMRAVTVGPDGLLVGVGAGVNSSGELVGAVWISSDGSTWERVTSSALTVSSEAIMQDVAWGTNGLVAVGSASAGSTPVIWHSPDGRDWIRLNMADQPFDSTGTLGFVTALESGYVIGGPHAVEDARGGWVTLWTSADGMNWDRVHAIGPGNAMAAVQGEAGLVVAGTIYGEESTNAAIWAGPPLDPTDPAPDPQPPVPPEAVEEPAEQESVVGLLGPGLSCEDLAAGGYTYAEAVSYWTLHDMPEDFDVDVDGAPCASAYPDEDVVAVFGESTALSVRFVANAPDGVFEATGSAVAAGLVCPEGTWSYVGDPESIDPTAVSWWQDVYTCGDRSGSFTLAVNEYIAEGPATQGIWRIVSGTGDYEALRGGGLIDSTHGEYNASTGRLWFETDEN